MEKLEEDSFLTPKQVVVAESVERSWGAVWHEEERVMFILTDNSETVRNARFSKQEQEEEEDQGFFLTFKAENGSLVKQKLTQRGLISGLGGTGKWNFAALLPSTTEGLPEELKLPFWRPHGRHRATEGPLCRFGVVANLAVTYHSSVWLCVHRHGGTALHVIKVIAEPTSPLALQEVETMRELSQVHDQHMVLLGLDTTVSPCMYSSLETPLTPRLCYVLPYASGGDLLSFVTQVATLTEQEVLTVARRVVLALDLLQLHGYVHLDVKPHNLLLMEPNRLDTIRLADFGHCYRMKGKTEALVPAVHSKGFISPEMSHRALTNGEAVVSWKTDIWGAGAVLLYMITRQFPNNLNEKDVEEATCNFEQVSMMISHMCSTEAKDRPTAREVLDEYFGEGQDDDNEGTTSNPRRRLPTRDARPKSLSLSGSAKKRLTF